MKEGVLETLSFVDKGLEPVEKVGKKGTEGADSQQSEQ